MSEGRHARNGSTEPKRPNVIVIMSDDHACQAISAYGSEINATPNIDRIANAGVRFDHCYCTNSLCAPSRATILTGTYSHVNGVMTLSTLFDSGQPTFPALMQGAGYQTALVGKWHLGHGPGHDPTGLSYWDVLPGQGRYWDPEFISLAGRRVVPGYCTDVITDLSIKWLEGIDHSRPFCLLIHHKAPHRPWQPDRTSRHEPPIPETFFDDYSGRGRAARNATMRVADDLRPEDLKEVEPSGLSGDDLAIWKYRRYMADYLACVESIDDNVGRVLDWLDDRELTEDTIVIYTSDQGFFLGEHGWFDKRFMYEESLRMPLLVQYPRQVPPGMSSEALVANVDFAQTILDYAGVMPHPRMQGRSLRPLLKGGSSPEDWRTSVYYRYWEHNSSSHHVWAHYGIRTERYKLIFYYSDGLGLPGTSDALYPPEWELFDLELDPMELNSVYDDPEYGPIRARLQRQLEDQQRSCGDVPWSPRWKPHQ